MATSNKNNLDDVVSFTMRTTGNLEAIKDVLSVNGYTTLDVIESLPEGSKIAYNEASTNYKLPAFENYRTKADIDKYKQINRKKLQQNLFDFVLTVSGSLNNIGDFITDNGITKLSDSGAFTFETLPAGTSFSLRDSYLPMLNVVATGSAQYSLLFGDFNSDFNFDFR